MKSIQSKQRFRQETPEKAEHQMLNKFTLIELLIVVSIIAILAGMLLLGNVTFLLYDVLLGRIGDLYVYRLRPKLFPHHFS